jgi:hypothetical protein
MYKANYLEKVLQNYAKYFDCAIKCVILRPKYRKIEVSEHINSIFSRFAGFLCGKEAAASDSSLGGSC